MAKVDPPPPSGLEQTRPSGERSRGLVSPPAVPDSLTVSTAPPRQGLQDLVEAMWQVRWDRGAEGPYTAELLADPSVNIAFERGSSRVVGVWTRLWTRTLAGKGRIRAVKLHPGMVRAITDRSASALTDRVTPLGEVLRCDVDALESAVLDPADDAEGFARLQDWLASMRLSIVDPHVERARSLVAQIAADPDLTTAQAVADRGGLTLRSLQRLFRDYVGASPKWVVRRFRLQDVAVRIERGEATNLATLAADLGYADAAHLTRDFKAATGKPPTIFARDLGAPR